jgi:hypothetical protein
MLLLVLPNCVWSTEPFKTPSASEYGLESETMYPGALVAELLAIAEQEAALAVKESYEAGYKAGRIDAAAEWLPRWESVQTEARKHTGDIVITALVSFISGALLAGSIAALAR